MILCAVGLCEYWRASMGNLRDQLKKIKITLTAKNKSNEWSFSSKNNELKHPSKLSIFLRSSINNANTSIETSIHKESDIKVNPVENSSPKVASTAQASSISTEINSVQLELTLPRYKALPSTSDFKPPDAWVARGSSSQMTSQSIVKRSDIFIGLDFGTAFTKAAVQIADNIYPVDWRGISNHKEQFLLPTEYCELPNKECFLGQHPNASPQNFHTNLKQSFINLLVSNDSLSKASIFVALVLQYIRAWVYQNHSGKLGSVSIGWHLNIGIPSDFLDKDRHAQHYKKLIDIAWELSLSPQTEITYSSAFSLLSHQIKHKPDLRSVGQVPELVAQLAGYSKSARRQKGLHTLIDIGGGTVDMVTFNIHQLDGDDVFPFFVAKVNPLGSYALLGNRFLSFKMQSSSIASSVQNLLADEAFSQLFNVSLREIQETDKRFFNSFQREFESVLSTTQRKRYPSSPNWGTGIRTFISGGGAFIPGYEQSIRRSRTPLNCPLLTMDLPPHPKLANFNQDPAQYSRISVACGLAVDEFSLGTIRPASEVEDAPPLIATVNGLPMRERPDRDELYPK